MLGKKQQTRPDLVNSMDKEEPKSIFDHASGKVPSSKPEKKGEKSESPSDAKSSSTPKKGEEKPSNIPKFNDPEVDEMINKIYAMKRDLNKQTIQTIKASGKTPQEVKKYISDPNNISPNFIQNVEASIDSFAKRLYKDQYNEYKKKQVKKKKKTIDKSRKGKTLGSRKKWMRME